MKINLGAADRHIDGYLCVDIAPPPCAVCDGADSRASLRNRKVDLADIWPWRTSSVEEVLALDVCEHVGDLEVEYYRRPRGEAGLVEMGTTGRIHFMNELHRVLMPGGRATIETPNAAKGVGYFQDCTHVSPWCFSSFKYFEHGAFAHTRLAKAYGITAAFKVLSLTESRSNGEDPREEVWKIKAIVEVVK